MNKVAAALIGLLAIPLWPIAAQTKPENLISPSVRLYQPKYLEGERAAHVAAFVSQAALASVSWEPAVGMMTIRAGAVKNLDDAEALLKRFDVSPPDRQFEFTVYLIRAFTRPDPSAGTVPSELAAVVKEMKGAFTYTGFRLGDTIVTSVRQFTKLDDTLPETVTGFGRPVPYSLAITEPFLSADGKTISAHRFQFTFSAPERGITTDLTIREGQTVVLGRVRAWEGSDLWLAVTAKVK